VGHRSLCLDPSGHLSYSAQPDRTAPAPKRPSLSLRKLYTAHAPVIWLSGSHQSQALVRGAHPHTAYTTQPSLQVRQLRYLIKRQRELNNIFYTGTGMVPVCASNVTKIELSKIWSRVGCYPFLPGAAATNLSFWTVP
jgi:hypothetical protein